ncbi:unnamed protein product, partial [Strongylus vulgaris]
FDKIVEEWKRKVDDIQKEIDATNRDSRNTSTEVFKLKSAMENLTEQCESLRRENKNYVQEIRDVNEQITQGGRTFHELQKAVKRIELEKEELQHALDEAEAALEAEESKVKELQGQVDDEQRRREEIRENYLAAEKRLAIALAETEEVLQRIDTAEKRVSRKEIIENLGLERVCGKREALCEKKISAHAALYGFVSNNHIAQT